jgi:hypothetical protein
LYFHNGFVVVVSLEKLSSSTPICGMSCRKLQTIFSLAAGRFKERGASSQAGTEVHLSRGLTKCGVVDLLGLEQEGGPLHPVAAWRATDGF